LVFLFNHRVPAAVLLQVTVEAVLFWLAIIVAAELNTSGQIAVQGAVVVPALIFAGLMVLMNLALGLYRQGFSDSAIHFIGSKLFALALGLPIAYLAFFFVPHGELFQRVLVESFLLAIAGLVLARGILLLSGVRADLLNHRVLIVGTGRDASAVEAAMDKPGAAGMQVAGFYPLSRSESAVVTSDRIVPPGSSLIEVAKKLRVNEIVVAAREQRGGALPLRDLVDCRLEGIRISCLPTFFERFRGEIPIDSLKAGWLIYADGFRQGWMRTSIKRGFDVTVSILLLLLTAPIMLAAAIAILIESGRPVIYRQERVGLGGRVFQVLKFRSMVTDAERDGVPRWTSHDDGRVTAVGNFIRRTRIDELPQIFNVLKGHMSFVGPRPERPYFVMQLSKQIPFYRARLSVKPGITGWAQIRFSYGASVEDAVRKLQFDLYYVKNHTLLLDLIIVVETVRVVLFGEGAR
jgi:sugar transferase (PEP-CTERM system associated)